MKTNRAGKFMSEGKSESAYKSFVPNNLPPNPSLCYDDELIYLVSEANRYIGRLDEITDILIAPIFFVYMYARKEAVDKARKIKALREIDTVKVQSLLRISENAIKLYNHLFNKPTVSIDSGVCILLELSYPNAEKMIDKFIDLGILKLFVERKRNKIYVYNDYLQLFKH